MQLSIKYQVFRKHQRDRICMDVFCLPDGEQDFSSLKAQMVPNPEDENIFVFKVLQRRICCHIRKHVNPNTAKARSFVKVQQK